MKLVIAEKPSAAQSLARVIGADKRQDGYAESTVKSRCGAEEFTKKGRTDLQLGWKAIWQHFYPDKKKDEDSIGQIPGQGKRLQIDSSALKEGKTSPSKPEQLSAVVNEALEK